jgi:hypothetical protein
MCFFNHHQSPDLHISDQCKTDTQKAMNRIEIFFLDLNLKLTYKGKNDYIL